MRMRRLWFGAGLGVALMVSAASAQTRERLPLPSAPGVLVSPPPPGTHVPLPGTHVPPPTHHETLPHFSGEVHGLVGHEGHAVHHEELEEPEAGGLFVIVDYLFLKPRRRPHDFAIVDPLLDTTVAGGVSNLSWDSNSGYRLTAGYGLSHGWEVAARYFYFHSSDDRAAFRPAGGALYATLTPPNIDEVDSALASSNLDMDVLDLELAKRLHLYEHLNLRLSGGFRYADIQQKLTVLYNGATAGLGAAGISSPIGFDGIGLRVGGEGLWRIGEHGLGLYAKMHGSLLSGDFRTRLTGTVNDGALTLIDVRDKFEKIVPVAEMGVGVAWERENIRLRVGYELSNWFGLVDSLDFVESTSFGKISHHRTGDLSLEGLAVSLGIFY